MSGLNRGSDTADQIKSKPVEQESMLGCKSIFEDGTISASELRQSVNRLFKSKIEMENANMINKT